MNARAWPLVSSLDCFKLRPAQPLQAAEPAAQEQATAPEPVAAETDAVMAAPAAQADDTLKSPTRPTIKDVADTELRAATPGLESHPIAVTPEQAASAQGAQEPEVSAAAAAVAAADKYKDFMALLD